MPPGGNVIRREWLRRYVRPPERFDRIVTSWDTASTISDKSDWSAGTVRGAVGLDYYLLDVRRSRLEVPDLRRAVVALSSHWSANATLIEDTELGRALVQDLRATDSLPAILQRPRFDKEARLLAQSSRFEAGQVLLPAKAPWLAEYVAEILAFPNGQHDDQVDSTSQALNWLTSRTAAAGPIVRANPEQTVVVNRRTLTR